jgi:hypothetical protein
MSDQSVNIEDIQIPVGAEVSCTDGLCGKLTYVLINPVTEKGTHLVVKQTTAHHPECMVPVELVAAMSNDMIQLKCTRDQLQHMDLFVQTHYIHEPMPQSEYDSGYVVSTHLMWPFAVSDSMAWVSVDEQQMPIGELAVRRGTRVKATDGNVGHVDEFLVHPGTGNITHLVMREGHLWGKKEVSIPVSAILKTREDTVLLKLNKLEIEALPSIPIRRPHSNKP